MNGTTPEPPQDNVVADPLFDDWQAGDFRFKPDSPAEKLGTHPLDVVAPGELETVRKGKTAPEDGSVPFPAC